MKTYLKHGHSIAILVFALLAVNCGGGNGNNENDGNDSAECAENADSAAVEKVKYLEGGKAVTGKIGTEALSVTANGISFRMLPVQGGTFTMGATPEQGSEVYDDEKPAHEVSLSDFYMAETEVTQKLWKAVMGSNPSRIRGSSSPVESVSWDDCHEFITRLNSLTGRTFRLPTEAEWEYAARGGNRGNGHRYAGSNSAGDVAWYFSNRTHQVAGKSPNELGLYDMSGNVYEWCQDVYGDYRGKAQTNPQGVSTGSSRVFRGGSWIGDVGSCRVSYRGHKLPANAENNLGLRLVMDVR